MTKRPPSLLGVIGGAARYILDEYERGACAAMPAVENTDLHVALDRAWPEGQKQAAPDLYVRTLPLLTLQAVYRMRLTKHVLMRRGALENADVRTLMPALDEPAIRRDPSDPSTIYDDLYDLMRVPGYTGGFYVDALAAIDIALWDIAGRCAGTSVATPLGGAVRDTIPAYVYGLPEATLEGRAALAPSWQSKGFDSFKFAPPVADHGAASELAALRETLGPNARIAADIHWNQTADESLSLIRAM